ncbi:MAG: hypothetical protein WBD59_11020, partial [Candidatus Sulfotelmatobacter sp.]
MYTEQCPTFTRIETVYYGLFGLLGNRQEVVQDRAGPSLRTPKGPEGLVGDVWQRTLELTDETRTAILRGNDQS